MSTELQHAIEAAFSGDTPAEDARGTVDEAIARLDRGDLSLAEQQADGTWSVNGWIQQAILLFFRLQKMEIIELGPYTYHDKVPLKSAVEGVRIVPPATVRYGAFVEPGAVLMPSYVNIGSHVGSGTMVDTWATVGSGAWIGKDVHLSGGVGIGGVLEPPGARPVIIEDGAFIGSRAIVVEGVHVGAEAVLGAGVILTASTKIIDVTGAEPVEHVGHVPPRKVVIPGTRPKQFPAGTFDVPCALIIGERTESTDRKTSLNAALRELDVDV
ncbi:MAG: 2,3,4,5-tetrahydropyridine-2,6-dicarboxylate N-succinyltransferase [Gaiellales bacterium]